MRPGRAREPQPNPDPVVGAGDVGGGGANPDRRGRPARPAGPALVVNLGPEDEALLPQANDNDGPRVAPPVIDIPRLSLDDLEPPELRGIVGLNPRDAQQALQRAREIKAIEKEYKITLGAEEKQLILNHRRGAQLSGIESSTDAILDKHYARLFGSDTRKARINKGRIEKIGTTAATIGASVGLRMALHALGLTIGAGTITGAVVGGLAGRYRAGKAEREKQHGLSGIQEQFNIIKNNTNDPRAEANALAFLNSYLKSDRFKGNASDFLKLLVLYQSTASHLIGDRDQHVGLAPIERANMTDTLKEFDTAANEACYEAAMKGMWNGIWKGAAIGAVSDVIGGLIHHWRVEHFKDIYLKEHAGYNNTFHQSYSNLNASAPDIRPDIHFDALNNGHGLDLQATPYGNTLSSTIHDGLQNGQLHVPDAYIQQMTHEINPVTGQLFTRPEATGQFVYNFNFAQVPNVGDHWNHGGVILMNRDGVQELMNRAVQFNAGHWSLDPATNIKTYIPEIDYQKFAEALRSSGTFLETQYPADYGMLHGTPNLLMNAAIKYAREQAAENIAQSAVMGAGIGLMTDRVTEAQANKISGAGGKDSGRGAQGVGEAGGATQEQQRQTRPATPAPPAAVVEPAAAAAAVVEEEAPAEVEPERLEEWQEMLDYNRTTFIAKADSTLSKTTQKAWIDMSEIEQNNIINLLNTIKTYNNRGSRFKIRLVVSQEDFNIETTSSPALDNPMLGLENAAQRLDFDFTNKNTTWPRLKLVESQPNDPGNPTLIRRGEIRVDRVRWEFLDANSRGQIKIEIARAQMPGRGGGYKKVWPGDDTRGILEVIGFSSDDSKLRILTPDQTVVEIGTNQLENISNLKVYHWGEGRNDGDYS